MVSKNKLTNWVFILAGPVLALVAFIVTYFLDPLGFGTQGPAAALPAFLLSVVILIINQSISLQHGLDRTSRYSDRIYEAIKDYMHVTPIGSPEKALEYISSRIPSLREVKNTSFNLDVEIERSNEKYYETAQYLDSMNRIATHTSRDLIWKDIGDQYAVNRFRFILKKSSSVSKVRESKYKYKLLQNPEPQINFIMMEYPDGSREVLFNWDFRGIGQDPTVLLSRDPHIIEMFSVHFEYLWRHAVQDHDNRQTKSSSEK